MGFINSEHLIVGGLCIGTLLVQSSSAGVVSFVVALFGYIAWTYGDFIYRVSVQPKFRVFKNKSSHSTQKVEL